nr:serine hydrolase domain-containing protein [Allomuricauda sp.]
MNTVLRISLAVFLLGCFEGQAQIEDQIDGYLKKVYQNHTIPGFAAVVVKEDKIVYRSGFGRRRLGKNAEFTHKTVSDIGSLTKSITAVAIMQLVEQNKVSLDTPVVHYLPDFRTANKEMSDKITVRMLLNNTAGLKSNPVPSYQRSSKALEHLLESLKTTFLSREPGASYEYSNTDFSIAGLLVERLTGMSYETYVEENIFAPLQMNSSISNSLALDSSHLLYGHYYGPKPLPAQNRGFVNSGEYVPAGSATQSTAEDLGNYLVALLQGGRFKGKEVVSEESIKQLWHPNISFQGLSKADGGTGKKYQYGLGWMISEIDGRNIVHHGGSTGTMSSFTMIDVANHTATSLLFNLDLTFIDRHQFIPHYTIANNILHLANGENISAFGIPIAEDETKNNFELHLKEMDRYIGEYHFESGGFAWMNFGLTLKVEITKQQRLKGKVLRDNETAREFYLDFINPSTCVTRNIASPETIRFTFTPKGEIKGLLWNGRLYKKKNEADIENLNTYTLAKHKRVVLPKDWIFEKTSSGFIASSGDSGSKITGWINSRSTGIDTSAMETYLANIQLTKRGLKTRQNFSTHTWEMQSFQTTQGAMLTVFSSIESESQIHFVLESNASDHTKNINHVMIPLITFLKVNSI